MQRTVKEFLWGYEDPLLFILKKNFPKLVPDDHVSVFNASVILFFFLSSDKFSFIIQSFTLK
jgi:hypothetical protein